MVYYPLSTLMLAGVREVMLITTPVDAPLFQRLLGDGSAWGMQISYATQGAPRGIAEALIIGEPFLHGQPSALILGDNLFFGHDLEKPAVAPSRWAVTGLYLYDEAAPALARTIKPSGRQGLEITDLNRAYLQRGELTVEQLGRGAAWYDTGTPEALLEAAQFVHALERRHGLRIGCPEEIAWRSGWIDTEALLRAAHPMRNTGYGRYLAGLVT